MRQAQWYLQDRLLWPDYKASIEILQLKHMLTSLPFVILINLLDVNAHCLLLCKICTCQCYSEPITSEQSFIALLYSTLGFGIV